MQFAAADVVDYAAMFPSRPARVWRLAAVQILSGPTWCLRHDGRRLALCGLYPLHSGILEAWLMLAPGIRPRAGALRFLLDRALTVFPDRIIVSRIDDANRAGGRMAVLAGFVPIDEHLPGTRIRTWVRPGGAPGDTPGAGSGNVTHDAAA